MPDRSLLTIVFALLQCSCGYPQFGFSAPEPTTDATPDTDKVSVDSAFDAPPETPPRSATCDGVDADLCDDFERGTVSSKWEGVEATGGLLTVVDAGLDSQFALSAAKPFAGAAHIMTKASAPAATGFRDSFAARVVRAPSDPGLGAFVTLGSIKGRSGFGIALFPQPGGVSNADLFVLKGARVRLGVVPVGVWTKFKVEVECAAACTARAQLNDSPWQQVELLPDTDSGENAAQFGLNCGIGGGDWSMEVDDVVLNWIR